MSLLLNQTGGFLMATRTLEVMRAYNTMITLRGQKVRNEEVAQASGMLPAATVSPERRCETRVEYRCMCSYEVLEAVGEELVVIEQGEAFALNSSTEGVLLFLGQPLHGKQLIRVDIARSGRDQIGNVFESRWTKPVQMESLGNLYLIGCRRISPSATIYGSNVPTIKPQLKTNSFS
jgi:hypothetical protein